MRTESLTGRVELGENASAKRRWQFSLRAIFIFVAFLIVAISHMKATLDLRAARRVMEQQAGEIGQLRGELGIFDIEDPAKAHTLFIRLKQPDAYRYRVYLPPRKREYEICVGTQGVSIGSVPDDMYQFQPLNGGGRSFFVDVFLAKDANGQYQWHVRHPRGEIFEPFTPFAVGGQSHIAAGNSPGTLVLSDPNQPIVLVLWVPSEGVAGAGTQGLAVWIR